MRGEQRSRDVIYRQDALDAVDIGNLHKGIVDALKNIISEIPSAARWIPCSERMPEENYETGNGVQFSEDVLVTIVNHANDGEKYTWVLKTVDGKWYDYSSTPHCIPNWCEVIAWMPLPEPWKGEENGKIC